MINKIKAVINQIISFVRSIRASAKLTPINSIFTEKSKLQNNSENYSIDEHIRMEAPNLLSSIEEVITDDFCVLSNSDTLSDALALVTIQGAIAVLK